MFENTPENSSHTWRDLADQLTAEQITRLEGLIRCTGNRELRWDDEELLCLARGYAGENLIAAMVGPVPLPAGSELADAWQEHDPLPERPRDAGRLGRQVCFLLQGTGN